jgi:crotonobetainyl-CoA:carnitine CoA-transferase CaiB-like acyl-CoA transferase
VTGPLTGIVVADLTRALAGPHATMLLGDLGARVIKVEQPGTGDDSRHWGPPFAGPPDDPVSTYFLSCNRNKESVTCDLKSSAGKEFLARLIRHSDVLVENFRPGVLDRAGFSHARLHELSPRLVICSISGFGHDGPEHDRPGYDQIVQGEAGLMSVTGPDRDHPVKSGLSIADVLAGLNATLGVLAALFERQQTGRGKVVRTSLLASVVGAHAFQATRWTVAGEVPHMTGNHHPSIAPYGAFRCADGMVQIAVANEQQWQRFAAVVGIDPDDGRFRVNHARVVHRDELTAEIEDLLASSGRGHWLGLLSAAGVPAGSIRTIDEVYGWAQTRSQGLVITVEHPLLGRIELPGPALRFGDDSASHGHSDTWPADAAVGTASASAVRPSADAARSDGAVGARAPSASAVSAAESAGQRTYAEHAPPPLLGQHDAAVRAWLDELDAAADDTA